MLFLALFITLKITQQNHFGNLLIGVWRLCIHKPLRHCIFPRVILCDTSNSIKMRVLVNTNWHFGFYAAQAYSLEKEQPLCSFHHLTWHLECIKSNSQVTTSNRRSSSIVCVNTQKVWTKGLLRWALLFDHTPKERDHRPKCHLFFSLWPLTHSSILRN